MVLPSDVKQKFEKSYKKCLLWLDRIFYNEIQFRETGEQRFSDSAHAAKEKLLHELDPFNFDGIMSFQVETGYPPIPPLNSPFRFGNRTRKRRANEHNEKPAAKRQTQLNTFFPKNNISNNIRMGQTN